MASAKVAMDWAKAANVSSSTVLTVPAHAYHTTQHNPLSLQPGDKISFRDALYATILTEDCVSSTTLANHVGLRLAQRRNVAADPIRVFTAEMNALAKALGMKRTRFLLPCGADSLRRNSYSTASDMARLALTLAKDSGFGFYAKQKSRKVVATKADGSQFSYQLQNTNGLLKSSLKVVGMKAGYSPVAGQCVSAVANKDFYITETADGKKKVTPVQLVVIVLASANAEQSGEKLIKQGWAEYENWRNQGYLAMSDRRGFLKMPLGQ